MTFSCCYKNVLSTSCVLWFYFKTFFTIQTTDSPDTIQSFLPEGILVQNRWRSIIVVQFRYYHKNKWNTRSVKSKTWTSDLLRRTWVWDKNDRYFVDISKCIFLNANLTILNHILVQYVAKGEGYNRSLLVQVMAGYRLDDKLLLEPMITRFTDTYICQLASVGIIGQHYLSGSPFTKHK